MFYKDFFQNTPYESTKTSITSEPSIFSLNQRVIIVQKFFFQ